MELKHEYVKVNGVNLHVVKAGPEDGQLVILLHGFPEFWYGWRKQIEPLAEAGYQVWVPDQRGYNLSDKPAKVADYDIDLLAKDVASLIEAAGKQKAFVVGHDWGGLVAWWTATIYPEKVEKLIITNVPHPVVATNLIKSKPAQLLKSWYIFFFQLPWLPEKAMSRNNWQLGLDSLRKTSRRGTFDEADLAEYSKAWSQPGAMTSMINWYRAFGRHALRWPKQVRIKPPTLILWGKRDAFIHPVAAQLSQDICEDAKLVYYEKASHWLQYEEAPDVNKRILEFIGEPALV